MGISTNYDSLNELQKKLRDKNNFQAKQSCKVYAYLAQDDERLLPRILLNFNKASAGFMSEKFNIKEFTNEALKSLNDDLVSKVESIVIEHNVRY